MSENKNHKTKAADTSICGKVVVRKTATGSKSERKAVFLQTETNVYQLRKWGGNPFQDASLEALKGKTVTVTGILEQQLFLAKEIKEEE